MSFLFSLYKLTVLSFEKTKKHVMYVMFRPLRLLNKRKRKKKKEDIQKALLRTILRKKVLNILTTTLRVD
jgi:hypothetical protein